MTVAKHQANHARILKLRQTTDSLDNQIKSTVTTLAETRKELLAIPSATEPNIPTRDVPFDELLAFAKNIAKFTLPPGHHLRPVNAQVPATELAAEPSIESSAETLKSGAPLRSPTQTQLSPTQPQSQAKDDESKNDPEGHAFSQLTAEQRSFLDDAQTLPFMPWPDFPLINAGILRQTQDMIAQGIDPATVRTEAEQEAWEQDIQEQRAKLEADDRQRHQEQRAQRLPEKPKEEYTGFAMFEDDEDMED